MNKLAAPSVPDQTLCTGFIPLNAKSGSDAARVFPKCKTADVGSAPLRSCRNGCPHLFAALARLLQIHCPLTSAASP